MIHKYKMNNYNIVLDVFSGAVHIVDDVVYDVIDYFENKNMDEIKNILKDKYDKNEINEAYEEIKTLKENEVLFTEDIYEDMILQINKRQPVVKALCLHIAHDCNLKCSYCFAEEGEYHGKRQLMSLEVGKKAIDFLIKNSGNRKNLEIDFFGGEPLLNFEVVKEIVKYARSLEDKYNKNFRFTITTNGILLNDEIIEFINKNMHNVVLSIDGRKEVNDKMRKRFDGSGSYDKIVPNFIKVAQSRNQNNYYVRGTFTRNNLDFSEDVIHLAELGFKQISVEPVVTEITQDYALKEEDIEKLFKEYEKLALKMIEMKKEGKGFNFFHFMIDLSGGACIAKRLSGCGSGTEYLAVTPEGDLYPCHQFVGMNEFKMGTVYEGVQNKQIRDKFENCNVYTKPDCKKCWAKFYCSGGCLANSYNMRNDLLLPYEIGCELQRKRTECAIMIKAAELD